MRKVVGTSSQSKRLSTDPGCVLSILVACYYPGIFHSLWHVITFDVTALER